MYSIDSDLPSQVNITSSRTFGLENPLGELVLSSRIMSSIQPLTSSLIKWNKSENFDQKLCLNMITNFVRINISEFFSKTDLHIISWVRAMA